MKKQTNIRPLVILCLVVLLGGGTAKSQSTLPHSFSNFISSINYDKLGSDEAQVTYTEVSDHTLKVSVTFDLKESVRQNDWQVNISPSFLPQFNWAPHLTPTDQHIIAQHVFRSPALVIASDQKQLAIVPDLDLLKNENPVDWYMDMDAGENTLTLGACRTL